MHSCRSVSVVRSALALALATSPLAAVSHADDKPAEVKTIGPAVPLSAAQLSDIAAKNDAQAAARAEPALRPLLSWKPKLLPVRMAPVESSLTPRVATAQYATAPNVFVSPRDKMPPRSPEPSRILPGLLDPFALKPDEVAVINGRLVRLRAGLPEAARRTP